MTAAAPVDTLRPLALADLPLVRAWRNAPAVRQHMFTTHEVTEDEHRRWFERVSTDPARRLWLFERDGLPQGFVQFGGVAPGAVSEWGFYAAPDAPRGTGRALGTLALERAFGELGLHKVCGQALGGNAASIRFHQALGFVAEGVLRQQHRDAEGRHHDLHCFGLLRTEWPPTKDPA